MIVGYMYPYYFDWTYLLIVIGMILALAAQAKVKSTFARYSKSYSKNGITGAESAEMILHANGIYDVSIEHIEGNLSDNYNSATKVLSLSDSTYNSTSVAAIGVAAHECGHAIQHAENYAPLGIRSAIVPIANIGANLSWPLILIGIIFSWNSVLINLGIIMFSAAVAFQLVTLPVEFNASGRALAILKARNILYDEELGQARDVLKAAALTYLAAAAASILQLLRLIILFGGRRRDD